ncbi:GNAT family N-acetyltransferase [Kitasatospora aureofaciens]|uniref:GNAT family N-acetyltransferase n=1 Tax=Kitasatospora aureofaciens TaxID=1894 RepID=UPI001C491A16|nr:GNAT family N-acetyltransferase [Kitasatospora aureofaciens]MBV6702543.1 GNAT family N-acetyltransferase [Kitasatospora aureofaciens]
MIELLTAHTAELDGTTLDEARALLFTVFGDEMTEGDWEHALGGVHAMVREGGVLIGHAAVVQRRLLHGGRSLRAAYVEGVAVRADRQGRRHGAALMDAVERVIRGAYDLGALGSSEEAVGFYARRGWQRWRGPLAAMTPRGMTPTRDEEGWVFVLPGAAPLDLAGLLTCDWRDGDLW